ncbi:hypothetical protein ACLKA7_010107 [Drosophila subpalustris]
MCFPYRELNPGLPANRFHCSLQSFNLTKQQGKTQMSRRTNEPNERNSVDNDNDDNDGDGDGDGEDEDDDENAKEWAAFQVLEC